MGELSTILPQGVNKVRVGRWEVPLRKFTLNELAAIEERFTQYDSAWDALTNFGVNIAVTRFVMWLLVRRVDKDVTEEEVGEAIDMDDLNKFVEQFAQFISAQEESERKKEEGDSSA